MGVAVPEDYRREVAMAGDWETVSVKPVMQTPPPPSTSDAKTGIKKEEEEEDESKDGVKAAESKAFGVRKRKLGAGEDEDEAALEAASQNKPWGSRFKTFPGGDMGVDDDIEALLGNGKAVKKDPMVPPEAIEREQPVGNDNPVIKEEDSEPALATLPGPVEGDASEKVEDMKGQFAPGAGIVFKKRKKAVAPK